MTGLEKFIDEMRKDGRSDHGSVMGLALKFLAEEQSKLPANADLVRELREWFSGIEATLDHWKDRPNEQYCIIEKDTAKEFHQILSKYRPLPAVKEAPKEVKEPAAKETPCTVSDFDCSGPCPYADKNRCIPCGYKKSDCPIHSVKEQGEAGLETIRAMGNNAGKLWPLFSDFMTACANGKTIVFRGNNFIAMDKTSWHNASTPAPVASGLSTADLIAELEKRRPDCYSCLNQHSRWCFKCRWDGLIKNEDNFKEAK